MRSVLSKINEHHLKCIKEIDVLCVAVLSNSQNDSVDRTITFLEEYSKNHLEFEEELMKKIDYPHYEMHLDEHNKLRDYFNFTFHNLNKMNAQEIMIFFQEIKNDLIFHIRHDDMQLISYYKERYNKS